MVVNRATGQPPGLLNCVKVSIRHQTDTFLESLLRRSVWKKSTTYLDKGGSLIISTLACTDSHEICAVMDSKLTASPKSNKY